MDLGLRTTAELRAAGVTQRRLRHAVATGRLVPVIRGWYATSTANPDAVQALRHGGRLGCISLLAALGAWRPEDRRLHLAMPEGADGRRPSGEAVRHWTIARAGCLSATKTSPMRVAVLHLVDCQPPEFAVAALDSLLRDHVISLQWLEQVLASSPAGARLIGEVDARAEAGIESVARFRFRQAGLLVEPQVTIEGVARLDLMLEGWLGVELDGREHHAQVAAFTADRTRDGRLVQRHRDVLHFGYAHVMHDWAFVQATVDAALLRRP